MRPLNSVKIIVQYTLKLEKRVQVGTNFKSQIILQLIRLEQEDQVNYTL